MARGSGPATQDFLPGEFHDPGSGVLYRVYLENGDAWLSFNRDGAALYTASESSNILSGQVIVGRHLSSATTVSRSNRPLIFIPSRVAHQVACGTWLRNIRVTEMPLNFKEEDSLRALALAWVSLGWIRFAACHRPSGKNLASDAGAKT
jgi:hypothetical protein